MNRRAVRMSVLGGLLIGWIVVLSLSGSAYRVIEEMEQYINGNTATVTGRIRWRQNVTIHVYIPTDPQRQGAEKEVEGACKAWEQKLRSETNANLTFQYHVGQSAPPLGPNDPPPHIIEVNWANESTTGEAGTATPVSQVTQTGPNTYQRGETYRGIINIYRNQSPNQPYNGNAIYNIALHEFGHIFGLDHKTPDQDSVIMDDRGIDDPNKKHPIKVDDVRGLQEINGRNPNSTVPPKDDDEEEEEEEGEGNGPSGALCCAFECGGAFSCAPVGSEFECETQYNGVIQPGTCETASEEDQEQGIYGRCNGDLDLGPLESCCRSDLGRSHYVAAPGSVPPGGQVSFILSISNDGTGPAWFSVSFAESPWLSEPELQSSNGFAPGSDPFDPPPAIGRGCIPPGTEGNLEYTATVSADAPAEEPVTSTVLLEDTIQRELYVFVAEVVVAAGDYTSIVPENIQACARSLAWASGYRHISHRDERWSVRENSPREMCVECGAPMCVVCMEYDLGTYAVRPGVTGSQRSCVRNVERYLRTATRQETEVLAAIYWTSYWDGRHNRNQP